MVSTVQFCQFLVCCFSTHAPPPCTTLCKSERRVSRALCSRRRCMQMQETRPSDIVVSSSPPPPKKRRQKWPGHSLPEHWKFGVYSSILHTALGFDSRSTGTGFGSPAAQVKRSYTRASVTEQYNLMPCVREGNRRPGVALAMLRIYSVAQKVSHYHESSLNRVKNRPAIKASFFINCDNKTSTRIW